MKRYKWTKEDDIWLTVHYKNLGAKNCASKLNLRLSQVVNRAYKLNLKLTKETKSNLLSKSPEKCNINYNKFYELKDKEIIYLLGLIWADGFLYSNNKQNNHLGFTMATKDIDELKPHLEKIGKWYYYNRKQPIKSWKPCTNVITNNKRIFSFLIENNYDKKSQISACKILSKIPDNLKHYWFRGLVDGDGCFYYYEPKKGSILRQFTVASTYEQDWGYLYDLCVGLNIKFNINKKISNKGHSYSEFRITNKVGIIAIGNYIYKDFDKDQLGLNRKYEKFKLISY